MKTLNKGALGRLRDDFNGGLILEDDPGYDEARALFNAMIDRRPHVIAQCRDVSDVVGALRYAREADLEVAVRGGGHSVAGRSLSDGGLVIDLRHMNAVSVDPVRRVATVAGGATMGDLDRATQPLGLATTGGRVSTTGVGGYVLGGGDGWMARKMGLACDNLLSAELVTADGEIVVASAEENPDLFWALHGGGGNFGVATSFSLRLHDMPTVTVAILLWPADKGPEILRTYRDFLDSAPDEVGGGFLYLTGPPEDFVPTHLHGQLTCAILLMYAGSEAAARQAGAPLLAHGHQAELIAEMPYAEMQCMLDDPPGYRNYWSAEYLASFPDAAVDRFCDSANAMIVPSPSQHVLIPQGGAINRVGGDWPISWRGAPWCAHPFGLWEDPADDARGRAWVHQVRSELQPWASGAVYLNFIGEEGQDRVVAGFGRENYERLSRIKAAYDPDNVFRLNHNIKPA